MVKVEEGIQFFRQNLNRFKNFLLEMIAVAGFILLIWVLT